MREGQGLVKYIFYILCLYFLCIMCTQQGLIQEFGLQGGPVFIKVRKGKFCEHFHSERPISDYFAQDFLPKISLIKII